MHLRTLANRIEQLAERGLLRVPDDDLQKERLAERFGADFVDLSSNDYLNGLVRRGVSRETSDGAPGGAGESVLGETSAGPPGSQRGSGLPQTGSEPSSATGRGPCKSGRMPGAVGSFPGEAGEAARIASPRTGEVGRAHPAEDGAPGSARGNAELGRHGSGAPGGVSRETSEAWGAGFAWGAGSSRLLHGSVAAHLAVEHLVAAWLGQPAALLFASGYAANVGALSALIDPEDCVVSDALNHASLIDGIRLSRAKPVIVPHLDLQEVEMALRAAADRPARWVVTEAYFSMDGDGPDLAALRALCDLYDAHLYVDEAHSLGVFGPDGRGRLAAAGVQADVVMGAFGKAVAAQGACVGSSELARTWLWNRARSFVFSTAVSPALAAGLASRIRLTQGADAQRARLERVVQEVRAGLAAQGWDVASGSFGPIVSLLVGTPQRAVELAAALEQEGVLLQAIRPPTVPEGGSRIRLTLHADLSGQQIERLLRALAVHAPQAASAAQRSGTRRHLGEAQ